MERNSATVDLCLVNSSCSKIIQVNDNRTTVQACNDKRAITHYFKSHDILHSTIVKERPPEPSFLLLKVDVVHIMTKGNTACIMDGTMVYLCQDNCPQPLKG